MGKGKGGKGGKVGTNWSKAKVVTLMKMKSPRRDLTTGVWMTLLKLVAGYTSKWPPKELGSFRSSV